MVIQDVQGVKIDKVSSADVSEICGDDMAKPTLPENAFRELASSQNRINELENDLIIAEEKLCVACQLLFSQAESFEKKIKSLEATVRAREDAINALTKHNIEISSENNTLSSRVQQYAIKLGHIEGNLKLEKERVHEHGDPSGDDYFLFKRALDTFGYSSQLDMLCEECAEFIAARNKHARNRIDLFDLFEEVADVYILIKQLQFASPIFFNEMVTRKKRRLQHRLDEHAAKGE
jgi:chromosome segregation ATPase